MVFGLPELDDAIYIYLERSDLVRCAQVNKTWNAAVIPHLWSNFHWTSAESSRKAYRRIVLEDYRYEQEYQNLYKGEGSAFGQLDLLTLERHTLPALTKYRRHIRTLPLPLSIRALFGPAKQEEDSPEEQEAYKLVCHLYQRCPGVRLPYLCLTGWVFRTGHLLNTIIEGVTPHVQHFEFKIDNFSQFLTLQKVLAHSSSKLEKLDLSVLIPYTEDKEEGELDQEQASGEKTHFKELRLVQCMDMSASKQFWPWFWRQCGQVKTLEIRDVGGIFQSLPGAIQDHMPNLNAIRMRVHERIRSDYTDDIVASVIKSCCDGLKEVTLIGLRTFKNASMRALEKHFATLERFVIDVRESPPGKDLVQILAHCPHLHTFSDVEELHDFRSQAHCVAANTFIDRDTNSGKLRPWKCANSLRMLGVRITEIPRPDLKGDGVVNESYPGQGREIQNLVYDRLGQLINLEVLCLGDSSLFGDVFPDCLEMSLESGLKKLAGLKQLKVLDVGGMRVTIGQQEAQWIVEHWPKLDLIYGLNGGTGLEWIQKHHPHIKFITFLEEVWLFPINPTRLFSTTMLGLPEIDDVICSHLERYDLARCARVNKQWHDSVIPHLWRNLSWFAWSSTSVSRLAFRRTILEDYLCEHGYRIEPSNDQVPTSLVKYSRWIWTLPSLHTLFTIFKPQATERQRPLDRKVQEPSVNELLFHLYKNCRSVRNITIPNYGPECDKLIEVIMEHVIPRVESLSIYTGPNDVRKLEQLLDRCSTALGSLTLSGVKIKTDEEINCAMEEQQCSKAWPMVKSLSLLSCSDNSQHKMFWTWLCRRYSSVEALLASDLGEVAQFLIPAISAHMPKLSDIYFSESSSSVQGMTDSVFASLLSCSRDGWKSVYITSRNLEFGEASKRALLEHCRTLEMLGVHECRAFFEFDLSKVLSSSPNLHTLDTISNDYGCSSSQDEVEQGLHFEMFVDKDLAGSLSVWECETTLTVLKIRISSIPRQDIGQGREMQGQVYDRLARLVNLEELWLGNGTLLPSACLPYEERYFQVNCLELSLDSGLEKLAGLKSLRELNVWGMDHNIRLKEAQWMTKHWPQLEALYGLDDRRTGLCYLTGEPWDDFYDEELVGWMAKNFPWINLTSYA